MHLPPELLFLNKKSFIYAYLLVITLCAFNNISHTASSRSPKNWFIKEMAPKKIVLSNNLTDDTLFAELRSEYISYYGHLALNGRMNLTRDGITDNYFMRQLNNVVPEHEKNEALKILKEWHIQISHPHTHAIPTPEGLATYLAMQPNHAQALLE